MTDQDVVKSLCELTASVQDLCNTINSEYKFQPNKSRVELKARDVILNTILEQRSKGQPEKIMDWEEVKPTPICEIEMKNKQYAKKYEDFWKDIDESTQLEKETTIQAYTSAFSRFEEIYRLIGWCDADDEDPMFDKPVLTESRDLLIESIFGIEAYQMSRFGEFSEKSRMLFELSRLPRLLIILVRIACRQIYVVGACGPKKPIKKRMFDAFTVVRVLAIVARKLKGFNMTSLSMEKLLHQCYTRQVLKQPGDSDVDTYHKQFDLIYDCMTALDFTRKFREIREPLCSLFYMRYKSDSIHMLFEHVRIHEDATIGIDPYPELPLEQNMDSMFHPDIFAIPYLREFGQLNIEWTDCLDEHLKIYANRNAIRVFAHPTFFYNGIDLHQDKRDFMESTYLELSLTYALLFRPISSVNLRRLGQYVTAGENQQIPWNNCVTFNGHPIHRFTLPEDKEVNNNLKLLSINPLQSPTKEILSESFYRCSLPPSTQVAFDIANPFRAVKGFTKRWDQHKVTPTSMKHILDLAPNYPEDLKFMIISVMEKNFADMESFVQFPYFAPRLRRLKTYLDSRQPRTIRQLCFIFKYMSNTTRHGTYTTEDIDRICLHALRCPDSLAVKNRLKESKDRLVHQSIEWILEDPQYKDWANGDEVGLLWIKGGGGKGKTMLSIGLIEQLARARAQDESTVVIYSFCQNADYELNTLEAILKGLILQLANQQPELKESLRRRWDTIQESFSEDVTSWQSLWNILFEMLARCKYSRVYMVVDALDECQDDDVVDFLKSIVRKGLDHPGKIKWMLTSRPWDGAERVLLAGQDQVQINLDGEHNSQSVSGAVEAYIASKVEELSRQHKYGATLKSEIETELTERSEGTFLWVSLVCKALESVCRDDALSTVQSLPPGLHPFYDRVLNQLNQGDLAEVQKCMRLLKAMMTVYRPLKVAEVASVIGLTDDEDTIRALVDCCASFIRLREDHIEFVHQSARDYLAGENGLSILDSHGRFGHEEIVLACLSYLSECLKPNLVDLPRPDSTRDSLEGLENKPKNGILSRVDYATMFWVSHLKNTSNDSDKSQASVFLHTKLLEWLECLSLLDRLPKAIDMLRALEEILKVDCQALAFVQDAMRFLLRHYHTLSHWPLQIYSSAVIFSPESSVVKGENLDKAPAWLGRAPPMEDSWTPMIQTLTGHLETVRNVAFSPDGKQIASGSDSGMIKLWDATTGSLQKTLLGDHVKKPSSSSWKHITAMAFLPDSKLILSANYDGSVMLWDTTTGDPQEMADHFGTSKASYTYLEPPEQGGFGLHAGAFSPDCKQIAAFGWSRGMTRIMLFDTATGDLQKILESHSHECSALAFSSDNRQLVSGSAAGDCTVRLWDTTTGDLQKTFIGHTDRVLSVAMSPDGKQIASGAFNAVILWNAATGDLLKTLASDCSWSVVFSPDSKHIAAGFEDGKIHIWDATGTLLKTLKRHAGTVTSIAFSPDLKQLVTCSIDATIKRWDNTIGGIQEAVGHSRPVTAMVLSPDGKVVASGSADKTIKLWDAATGDLQKPLAGHLDTVEKVVFSLDNRQIVSCSSEAVKIWDAATGEVQTSVESDDAFTTVAVSPDGKHIASGHCNGKIRLWDTATGSLLKIMAGYRSKFDSLVTTEIFNKQLQKAIFETQITRLVFSPDAKLILSTSTDKTLKLWDAATGDLLKRLPCHSDNIITEAYLSTTDYSNWIFSVAFSSDGQHIAAASADKTIRVWSIKKSLKAPKYLGRAVGSHIKSSRPWKEIKTSAQVYTVKFSAGNRYLATDIGPIALESTPAEGEGQLPERSDSDSSQNLCLRDQWLCYGAMPFLRLSPDFYATRWDTHGDRVVVGCDNGQVSSFNIDRRSLHAYWETLEL